ncbi:MAG: hypothetical protein V7646_7104 [Pseudonocardia sp.]|jgi:hypothetical protein
MHATIAVTTYPACPTTLHSHCYGLRDHHIRVLPTTTPSA